MKSTTIAVLVASWFCLFKTSSTRRPPHPPQTGPLDAERLPHWNPATPYLKPDYHLIVFKDTSPGYIRRPIFERKRLGESWCQFPYNCVPGIVCPEQTCVPGLQCCRSLVGICCLPYNYTLTHYPPILPPYMTPPPPYPFPVVHYPLPQHKLRITPSSYNFPSNERFISEVLPIGVGRPPR